MSFTLTPAVQDIDRTELFYREILQFSVERFVPAEGHPPVLLLKDGDALLLFREREVLSAMHPAIFEHLDRHPAGTGLTLEFTVDDLRPICRILDRRRMHVLYELEDAQHRRREVWLHDPDGYLVILNQEPESAKEVESAPFLLNGMEPS